MPHIRMASPQDVDLIAKQRWQMFADNGLGTNEALAEMVLRFGPWLRARLETGQYMGLLLSEMPETEIVAAAGILFMDWAPHYLDPEPIRDYLLQFLYFSSFTWAWLWEAGTR